MDASPADRLCDARCHEARGPLCECVCGGRNHGAAWQPGGVERVIREAAGELVGKLRGTARQMSLQMNGRQHGMEQTAEQLKKQIDTMSYEDLLRRWRFAESGDPLFVGEVGHYYQETMRRKRAEVGDAAHTAASKRIGW
jgi:hypothetical protein